MDDLGVPLFCGNTPINPGITVFGDGLCRLNPFFEKKIVISWNLES